MSEAKLNEILKKIEEKEEAGLELAEFHGQNHEDIQGFLETMERVAKINQWSNQKKIQQLTKKLKGPAYEYFMHDVIQDEVPTWEEIKTRLNEQYGMDETTWELIIQKTKQKDNEDPVMYARKIIRLCKKQNPDMSEKAMCIKVLQGMQPEEREQIQALDNETTTKLITNLKIMKENSERFNKEGSKKLLEAMKIIRQEMEKITGGKKEKKEGVKE